MDEQRVVIFPSIINYDPSTCTFSFNMHIFYQQTHFHSISTFSFNKHVFGQQTYFHSIDTFFVQQVHFRSTGTILSISTFSHPINKTIFFPPETHLVAVFVHHTGQRLVLSKIMLSRKIFLKPSIRATVSVCVKFLFYFSIKTYFFYITRSLLQNTHIRLSIIHPFLFKYSFLLLFLPLFFLTCYLSFSSLTCSLISQLSSLQSSDHHKTSLAEPPQPKLKQPPQRRTSMVGPPT